MKRHRSRQRPKTPGIAVVALVTSFICFPVGLILGVVALVQINGSHGRMGGKGVAIASLVIAALGLPMVGLLTAIAIPNFIRYQLRSKREEVPKTLIAIARAQDKARESYGRYMRAEPSLPNPGPEKQFWAAEICDPGCAYDQWKQCQSFDCFEFAPAEPVFFSYACEVTADGQNYTCAALGDLDDDGEPSLFVLGTGDEGLEAPIPAFNGRAPDCPDAVPNKIIWCTGNSVF